MAHSTLGGSAGSDPAGAAFITATATGPAGHASVLSAATQAAA